jgi:RecA/RadA recombinase
MSAIKKLKAEFVKNKVKLMDNSKLVPTGNDYLDFSNGFTNDEGEIEFGIPLGRLIHLIGKSGSGKSTLAYDIAGSILRNFERADCVVYDVERAAKNTRVRKLMRISKARFDEDVLIQNMDTNSENLQALLFSIYKEKCKDNPKDYLMEDDDGNTIVAPTVIILDSLAGLMSIDIQEDESVKLGMTAATQAKTNNAFFKQGVNIFAKANITFIIVNHIGKNISINPMQPVQAQLNTLKADENVPGGKDALYLADFGIKLEFKKKLEPDSEYGIKGYISTAMFFKSRTNTAGKMIELVFSQNDGFDNILTNYHLLKSQKKILGAGRSFYVEGIEDVKFSQKDYKAKYLADKKFARKVDAIVEEYLIGIVPDLPQENEYEEDED